MDTTVFQGRPTEGKRSDKEEKVYDLLEQLQIPFERMDHEPLYTIEACEEVDRTFGTRMCKNLFLCNSQKTKFYLLLMPGDKRFDTKTFCRQIESPRLSFADARYMEKYLNITPGSVSILGLMNDTEGMVRLMMDEEVLAEEYIGCHPCVNTSSLKIKTKDILEKFLPYVGHEYMAVKL